MLVWILALILLFFLFNFTTYDHFQPYNITTSGRHSIPPGTTSINLLGGGGGGASVDNSGHFYPGGGGGSGFWAGQSFIPANVKYIDVIIGSGGETDQDGSPTIVVLQDINGTPLQTLVAAGGKTGQQGYLSSSDVSIAGSGGDGTCGGGGGSVKYVSIHYAARIGSGGNGAIPQNHGGNGLLYPDCCVNTNATPNGGQGGCGGGPGGQSWNNLGGGGGGGGIGGGSGGADGGIGSAGSDATGYSSGGGGAAYGSDEGPSYLAGGKGMSGIVVLT
jgi:hypothetical protein